MKMKVLVTAFSSCSRQVKAISSLRAQTLYSRSCGHFAVQKWDVSTRKSAVELVDFADTIKEDTKAIIFQDLRVYPDFVSPEEEANILQEIEPYLQRMRYEFDHWDDAIHGFRETERLRWNQRNKEVLGRVTEIALPPGLPPLQHVHILDLAPTGVIKPHIDSIRFCGNTITGLSLLSDSVLRLVHEKNKDWVVTALLPRRSLYVMTNSIRYDYTHAILEDKESFFKGTKVPRGRRISVICRNAPPPNDSEFR